MRQLFAVAILFSALGTDDEKEVAKFQGSWDIDTVVINGTTTKVEDGTSMPLRIVEKTVTHVLPNGLEMKGTLTLDTSKSPKEFDLQFDPLPNGIVPPPLKGIYEIEKDTMKWCVSIDPEGERPRKFTSGLGEKRRLQVYKRN